MLRRILVILLFIVILICGYGVVRIRPILPIEIIPSGESPSAETAGGEAVEAEGEAAEPTPEPSPTPTPGPTPTPADLLSALSSGPDVIRDETGNYFIITNEAGDLAPTRRLPRHGILIVLLPLVFLGGVWLIAEFFIVRYIQPLAADLTTVRIKAKDGLFVNAVVSMTARRALTLASTRMTWSRVRNFVEKTVEQEIIHEAIQFASLQELEQSIKQVTERLMELPITEDLSRDFGVEVLYFNIEIRYTPETMDALQRKAEASAGGTAYLAYAEAAHLDPDRPESRELYRIFQETSSQVDAARNLGGGISDLLRSLNRSEQRELEDDETDER